MTHWLTWLFIYFPISNPIDLWLECKRLFISNLQKLCHNLIFISFKCSIKSPATRNSKHVSIWLFKQCWTHILRPLYTRSFHSGTFTCSLKIAIHPNFQEKRPSIRSKLSPNQSYRYEATVLQELHSHIVNFWEKHHLHQQTSSDSKVEGKK